MRGAMLVCGRVVVVMLVRLGRRLGPGAVVMAMPRGLFGGRRGMVMVVMAMAGRGGGLVPVMPVMVGGGLCRLGMVVAVMRGLVRGRVVMVAMMRRRRGSGRGRVMMAMMVRRRLRARRAQGPHRRRGQCRRQNPAPDRHVAPSVSCGRSCGRWARMPRHAPGASRTRHRRLMPARRPTGQAGTRRIGGRTPQAHGQHRFTLTMRQPPPHHGRGPGRGFAPIRCPFNRRVRHPCAAVIR